MNIGIVGAGQMGAGIAQTYLMAGFTVFICDQDAASLARAKTYIFNSIEKSFSKGQIQTKPNLSKLNPLEKLDDLHACDFVIEAIIEDFSAKTNLFAKLETIINESCILATNTSALSVNMLQEKQKKPERFLGVHYMNPPTMIPLVEIIKGHYTNDVSVKTTLEILNATQHEVVHVKDSPGFILNRILLPMINEAARLYDQNVASKEDIDKAMKLGANFPMGPLALADYIGIDTVVAILKTLIANQQIQSPIATCLFSLQEQKKLGKKTGSGFYQYEA